MDMITRNINRVIIFFEREEKTSDDVEKQTRFSGEKADALSLPIPYDGVDDYSDACSNCDRDWLFFLRQCHHE